MKNKEILKKQVVYRSTHSGSKEMDIFLGNFTKKYIDKFNYDELTNLLNILDVEDEIIYKWYFDKIDNNLIPNNNVSILLRNHKL